MTESAQVIGRKSNWAQSKEVVPVKGKIGQADRTDLFKTMRYNYHNY